MFSVNTNLGSLAALSSLSSTQSALQTTQNEVATGKKVSSASDNPAIYAISQAMTDRIAGLSAVSDNLSFAQSVIGTAQAAATQISSQLASLKSTITQGQTAGIDATTINSQITSILSNINSIANSASFNGVNIAGGTQKDGITNTISTSMNVTEDIAGNTMSIAQQDMTTGATGLGLTGLAVNAGALNLTVGSTATSTSFQGTVVALKGGPATGTVTNPATTYDFEFTDGTGQLASVPTQTLNTSGKVTSQTKVIAVNIDPNTQSVNEMTAALTTAMRANGFGVATQSDGSLDITGNNIDPVAADSTITTTTSSDFALSATTTTSGDAIQTVDAAISALGTKTSTLGSASDQISGLQNFSSALSTALTTGLGALTDADMATESAKLSSLQTKQSLGIQALSIANQQPQSLLTLFR